MTEHSSGLSTGCARTSQLQNVMAAPTCPDGFMKDPYVWRSESCPVSTSVYRASAWSFVFAWIVVLISAVTQLAAHYFARHLIPAWALRSWWSLAMLMTCAVLVLPWGFHIATSRAGAADTPTPELLCCTCSNFLLMVVNIPIRYRDMMQTAIHHVHALNAPRSRHMMRIVNGFVALTVLVNIGVAVAWACTLFASTESAQNASVAVMFITSSSTCFSRRAGCRPPRAPSPGS